MNFPHHIPYHGAYNPAVNTVFKQIPGCFWGPAHGGPKNWLVPRNALGVVGKAVAGVGGWWPTAKLIAAAKDVMWARREVEDLRTYQKESVRRAVLGPLLCAQEMRMGKTASAIRAMKSKQVATALIVGPAIARGVWLKELDKWWAGHPPVKALLPGEDFPDTPFVVCSYEGLKKAPLQQFDALIGDESFYLKDSRSARSQQFLTLRQLSPDALIMLLSGMPIGISTIDLWHQLHILEPYAWGTYKQFAKRYCIVEANQYSEVAKVYGVNEAWQDELHARLAHTVHRVVKSDYPELFMAPTVDSIEVEYKKKKSERVKSWLNGGALKLAAVEKWLDTTNNVRVETVVEWAEMAEKGLVFTYLKATARTIAEKLGDRAILITGDETPERRMKRLEKWKVGDVIVATMSSCKTAIDLSFCTTVCFAELYPDPELVGQALSRLDIAGRPFSAYLVKLVGTIDEAICEVLGERIAAEGAAIGNSAATKGIKSALGGKAESVDEWAARMGGMVLEQEEE